MIDQATRFEQAALQAIATRNEENGQADADRKARERLEREANQELLAAASPKDRDILRKEQERLRRASAAVHIAEAAVGQARDEYVVGRVGGLNVSERAIDATDAKYQKAKRDRALAQDVVERLEARMVAQVREDRRKRAEAALADIAGRWKATSEKLLGAFDLVGELARLHGAEQEAARDFAAASGNLPVRWSTTHERPVPINGFGQEHVKTPELDIGITLDGALVTREQLADRLRV